MFANNYEYSTVRKWLLETFLNTAFSEIQKQIISITEVDNGLDSTGYNLDDHPEAEKYISNNTKDKLFLLSAQEFDNIPDKQKEPTSYARVQGAYCNSNTFGYWRLRTFYLVSPTGNSTNNSYCVKLVNNVGNVDYKIVHHNYIGIVPAMWIRV